jgi:xanthine dehydrogenase large subunit
MNSPNAPKPTIHESAVGHVTGRAVYADEQHPPQGLLSLYPVQAPHAHARIGAIDASIAMTMPGVVTVLTAADVPGVNDLGPIVHDEPVMPADRVSFFGQAVAWVVAEDEAQAAAAAKAVRVDYAPLPALLDVHAAIAANAFHLPPAKVERGDAGAGLANAPHRLHGELMIGGQDHFYLETQACWAKSTAKAWCN